MLVPQHDVLRRQRLVIECLWNIFILEVSLASGDGGVVRWLFDWSET